MILEAVIKWGVTALLGGILAYLTKKIKDVIANDHVIKESMVLLLRSQIVGKCEKYLELKYLPDYARSCLDDLLTQYKALGGNHGVEILVNQCFNLPPKKEG